jgi:hypothetical protein
MAADFRCWEGVSEVLTAGLSDVAIAPAPNCALEVLGKFDAA